MMGKMPKAAPTPEQPAPVSLPSPDDPEVLNARRKRLASVAEGKQGRSSTQLSSDSGPSYNRTTLG
jgi:hypothetical protein